MVKKIGHDVYSGEDWMKKESLRKQKMEIIIFEKNKMVPLPKEQQQSYEKTKICYICKKRSYIRTLMTKIYHIDMAIKM